MRPTNPPRADAEDYTQFVIATPSGCSAVEAARVQPAGPRPPAHDAFTRLPIRLEPETLWIAAGDPADVVSYFEENQHPNLMIRGYLFGVGKNLRFQVGYSFLNRCPSPLSSKVHGSPRM